MADTHPFIKPLQAEIHAIMAGAKERPLDLSHQRPMAAVLHMMARERVSELGSMPGNFGTLLKSAFDDAEVIAYGAYNFALHHSKTAGESKEVARNSLGLLCLANLDDESWQATQRIWRVNFGDRALPLDKLQWGDVEQTRVELNDITKESARETPRSGCPARGVILNHFYQRYVDLVL